jgi:chromosome segregation ATPase
MGEIDRVFDLQLTIQKLQEEVSLYRNGINGQELLELLAEKDSEIENLKVAVNEKSDQLKKLAKKSAEVLAKCDTLQRECLAASSKAQAREDECRHLQGLVYELENKNLSSAALCEEKTLTIDFLENELAVKDDNIEKLQLRCASLGNYWYMLDSNFPIRIVLNYFPV